ncbi:MAG TPA: GNAT family N-acetyltransferase [Clostridia bacterium]|nr:GNAT family N-acetyltransferase [Clostridia bacterium]
MAEEKNELIFEEEEPPGIDFLCSSFLNTQAIRPLKGSVNLLQIKQENITVRVETNLEICRELFEKFSPKKTLFELWGFRYAFYLGYKHQPVFMIFERGGEPIGLLPLWYEKDKNELRWFGSYWQEANTFWFKEKTLIPIIFTLFPRKILLNAISVAPKIAKKLGLETDDPKYMLSLEQYPNLESFLLTLSGKKRYNLKRDQRIILAQSPQTIINRFEDINAHFKLSLKRFTPRDGSPYEDERRKETFRQIINQAGEYEFRMISTEINDKLAGVDLVTIYKGVYYCLQGAYDIVHFPGIGNYTNLLQIQDAINLGCREIDFLEVAHGWKDSWFEPIPLFQFKGVPEKIT